MNKFVKWGLIVFFGLPAICGIAGLFVADPAAKTDKPAVVEVAMTEEEKVIAEATKTNKEQTAAIKNALDGVGVTKITDIKYDEMYDHKGEKGYRITSHGLNNVILITKDSAVLEIRYAGKKLYADGKANGNLRDFYFTNEEITKLGLNTERAIKACLKSPNSADFPNWFKWQYARDKDKTILVASYVDAKNAFNAEIRSNFLVRFSESGDTVLQIIIDGKEVYNILKQLRFNVIIQCGKYFFRTIIALYFVLRYSDICIIKRNWILGKIIQYDARMAQNQNNKNAEVLGE